MRNRYQIVGKSYNKKDVDCYTRICQILMNGIEVEAWGVKHQLARFLDDNEGKIKLSQIGRIENTQK